MKLKNSNFITITSFNSKNKKDIFQIIYFKYNKKKHYPKNHSIIKKMLFYKTSISFNSLNSKD